MYYFFVGLTKAKGNMLVEKFDCASDDTINGVSGIIIDSEDRDEALRLLGKDVAKQLPTVDDGVYVLLLEGQKPKIIEKIVRPFRVTVTVPNSCRDGDYFYSKDLKKIAEEVLLPKFERDIEVVRYAGDTYVDESCNEVFRIHVWCSRTGTFDDGKSIRTRMVFGFDTMGDNWSWYGPSYGGLIIADPESGSPVAEIIGDDLYIFPPVAIRRIETGLLIFRRILEEVAAELSLSPEQRVERDRQRAEAEKVRLAREHAESRVRYIELCKQRLLQVVEDARVRVRESEGVLEQVQGSIVVTQRELTGSKRKLEQLRLVKTAEDKRFAEEFEKICAVPEVEEVRMLEGKTLQIMTSVLVCRDPNTGKFYELGKFRIDLPINGGNVRWFNLTRRVDGLEPGMHSPVVDGNGCTLLFNAIQAFPELIASYEIATAVMLALQVPGSIDPNEEYAKYLDKWPEVAPAASAA